MGPFNLAQSLKGGDLNAEISETQAHGTTAPVILSRSQAAFVEAAADWVPDVMLCKNPYVNVAGEAYGCGQCLPCRINRKRIWTHRIHLEALQYADNAFITLSYADAKLPPAGSLVPRDLQKFLYLVRTKIRRSSVPRLVRFFGVGEYGDSTERPHYHVALFNYPHCLRGFTRYSRTHNANDCCEPCRFIQECWGHGNIYIGILEPKSAAYIAGYITKKMTAKDDERLDGRYPEFARMSNRPGIGASAMWELASVHLQYFEKEEDVRNALRHGKTIKPLGRYLTHQLRKQVGRDEKAPDSVLVKKAEELRELREKAALIAGTGYGSVETRRTILKNLIIDQSQGKIDSIETRHRIWGKKRSSI